MEQTPNIYMLILMSNNDVVLIVSGIILAIVVFIAAFFLWKYVKKCIETLKQNLLPNKTNSIDIKLFENPISVRTVKIQQPFITSKFGNHGNILESVQKRRFTVLDVYKSQTTPNFSLKRRKNLQLNIPEDLKYYLKSLIKELKTSNQTSNQTSKAPKSSLKDQSESTQEKEINSTKSSTESKKSKKQVTWNLTKSNSISNELHQNTGCLTFRSEYLENSKTIIIHILRLIDLVSQKPANEVNPFIQAYLLPGKLQVHNTKYQRGKKKIYFDEKLNFLNISEKDKNIYTLKIKVLNHVRLTRCETLGKGEVPLKSLHLNSSQTYRVNLFVKKNLEKIEPLLMVSLNHHTILNKLEVIIHQAKNLPESSSYVYVIVALVKLDYVEKKNSAPRQLINQQGLDEYFEFHVQTSVDSPLKSFSLVITLVKKVNFKTDVIFGHVIFSECFFYSAAASHWIAVENTPNKRITEWHSLINPDIK
ncbi:synaptotagmin 1-like [Hydra vulgaris]|uniref:Synaptotagmin 1-like n=1 Tax=Hydra vulgaris TaxID=6087 RepID=A0ABM4CU11_HYDVU